MELFRLMRHDWNEKAQEESGYKTQDSPKEKENEKAQEITEKHWTSP